MKPLPFRFEDWLEKTSAGVFAVRSAPLKTLDQALRTYDRAASMHMANEAHLLAVRDALLKFIAAEDARSGMESWKRSSRNRDRIIEDLVTAVGLGVTADHNDVQAFAWDEAMVPEVSEPELDPIVLPPVPQIDPQLEARAKRLTAGPEARGGLTPSKLPQELAPPTPTVSPYPSPQAHQLARRPPRLPSRSEGVAPAELAPLSPSDASVTHVRVEVESLNSDLIRLAGTFSEKLNADRSYYANCVTKGFKDFKDLHALESEAINFKLSLAKSAFEALKAAPFPFSILGSIGAAVVGQFKADTEWTSLRVELPTPAGIMGTIEGAGKAFKEATTVGVSPGALNSQETVINTFLLHVENFRQDMKKGFEERIKPLDNWDNRRVLAQQLAADAMRTNVDPRENALTFLRRIGDDISRLFDEFLRLSQSGLDDVSAWITVQMIADYALTGVCKDKDVKQMTVGELGGMAFGDPFARFLATPIVDVVRLKDKSGASADIYSGGKIPWNGSANHKIAIFLYLDWFRRNINPYLMLTGALHPRQVNHYSQEYIWNLGSAMKTHKATAFKNVQGIQQAVDRAAQSTSAASIGGNIGDAFSHGL
jgi:hypothetical protein